MIRRDKSGGGLYDPFFEHDACGVGFVANIDGTRSHAIIQQGLTVLENLTHRGACGCDPETGDGAGMLIQIPDGFLRKVCSPLGIELPPEGEYGVGLIFLPRDEAQRRFCEETLERVTEQEGFRFLGWRDVDVDESYCGPLARSTAPHLRHVFVAPREALDRDSLERKLFVIRKQAERLCYAESSVSELFYVASLSCRTLVYKGLLLPEQIPGYFPDLCDEDLVSCLALVHQRFSTNTLPSWDRAQPFRYLAHNGEINTLRGNINWMHAREARFETPLFDDPTKFFPVVEPEGSDSAVFDNALELLEHTGRSLPHAVMMMIPEAWQNHESMPDDKRAFYEYHSCMMEPWDGPASIAFTDGTVIGAVLDRNGLRPSRYVVTKDGFVVMASEVGVLEIDPANVLYKNRLQPGRMFLVDTEQGRIIEDDEIKHGMATAHPYGAWLEDNLVRPAELPESANAESIEARDDLLTAQQVFGYSLEDLRILLRPMAVDGQEPIGSMGNDTPLAVLSKKSQLVFNYFKQLFAQVTNPPIDPIREDIIMSTVTTIGPQENLFETTPEHCRQMRLETPVLSNAELGKLRDCTRSGLRSATLPMLYVAAEGGAGLERALEELCDAAVAAIDDGATILILSDRGFDDTKAPIPSLLACGAVHHHLIRVGKRMSCGLAIETGEAREVMHFCLLLGYGAEAINPYLAFETLSGMIDDGRVQGVDKAKAAKNYVKALNKGMLKVASKMGISTLQSYRGAQIFECVGLNHDVIDKYFSWTPSRIEGVGLDAIARESGERHHYAFGVSPSLDGELVVGGQYQWRRRGEYHMYNPESIAKLQHSVRSGNYQMFKQYSALANDGSRELATLRGMLKFKQREAIPIDEVEPASQIVKRFKTGAMSLGSISREAHETLAIAMNRIGGRSNTGEGGEDTVRFKPDENGDLRRSSIKQVASGRFGVTSNYLVNSDEIQIKMAQGAKPGEGGQLPGHKVDEYIAKIRHSTPGVGLISPPPHHDIYSIEDLSQLIHDLKNANNRARISVKLVAEIGVGTVAAGVSKGKADVVLISGHDGGTGASPQTSIKHAGLPWELGLAETQQVLVENDLRGRICVETDGQLKTGRDVVIAALLGAEEYGFASSALVAEGCIMMRVCHLNTCPVGIATQDERLRKKFAGKPEHVVNFMMFIAEEVRELMAELGFRTIDEMVGRVDVLDAVEAVDHWKAKGIDLSKILHRPDVGDDIATHCVEEQDHGLDKALDNRLIELARDAIDNRKPVEIEMEIRNINRTVCTMLSAEISRRWGEEGLPEGTISLNFHGTGGQSFGAFMASGISVHLVGDANDYFGKGMSAGRIVIVPPAEATFVPEENSIVGNVALYGATGGEVFLRGMAGERFGVRNSGAVAVVEGVGDHGCEYMTGGRVVVLGAAGRNFAAGMSGGIAYVLDEDSSFATRCNMGMVTLGPVEGEEEAFLKGLIEKHRVLTDSAVADRLLSAWSESAAKFVRVMPIDYARVLAERERATATAEERATA